MATGGFQVHDRVSKKLICDLCDTKVDTCIYKCVDCNKYICDICTRAHNRLKDFRNHKILKDQHGPLPTYRADSRCTSHPGEEVQFYCYTCVTFICSFCITSNHSNHKCSVIKQASEEMSAELRDQLSNLKDNHITVLRSHEKKFGNLQTHNKERNEFNVKRFQAQTDAIVQEIKKIQTKRMQESEETTNQNKSRLSELQDNVVKRAEELESKYSDFNRTLTSGSDIDKIVARNELIELLGQCQSHIKHEEIQILKFVAGNIEITSLQRLFGMIDVLVGDTADADCFNKDCPTDDSAQKISSTDPRTIDSATAGDQRNNTPEPQSKKQERIRYSTDKGISSDTAPDISLNIISQFKHRSDIVCSICPVSDTTAYLACRDEYSIDRVDKTGQLLGSTKLDFEVCDFVVTSECDFICTDYNSKNIYKVTKKGQITHKLYTGPLEPNCLCLSSDGHILVTMYDNWSYEVNEKSKRLVTKMTTTGQILATYEYNNDTRLFISPSGIDENTNKDICVVNQTSDDSSHIVILGSSGRLKCTYKGHGSEMFDPARVKCDKFGHIIVSDWNNKKIHVLNSNGQLIKHLMTDRVLQDCPYSLAIDTNNLLWVGCSYGQVYVVKYLESP